jgi:hypothetical protein
MIVGTCPEDRGSPIFIRSYGGRYHEDLISAFHADAELLLAQGYEPVGQHYVDGEWSIWRALAATLLLAVFFIGALFWAQMLVQRPVGTLTVTYVRRASAK